MARVLRHGQERRDKAEVKDKSEAKVKVRAKRDDDVAEVSLPKKGPLDCKVFLPATGTVVTAKCNE